MSDLRHVYDDGWDALKSVLYPEFGKDYMIAKEPMVWDAAHKLKRQDDRIEELLAGIGRCERRAEADMNTIRALRKENEKLVDECCQLKEGYTSIRVQFATFTKTVGGAFANAFKEGFMEGWMDGKHGTSPDPSPVVDAAWEKSKHINFINMVDCGGGDE